MTGRPPFMLSYLVYPSDDGSGVVAVILVYASVCAGGRTYRVLRWVQRSNESTGGEWSPLDRMSDFAWS